MRKLEAQLGGVVSVGYGGRRLGELIDLLIDHDVKAVIDVRQSPRTRVPGFGGSYLARRLSEAGVEYRHEVDLGNPSDNREAVRSGDPNGIATFRQVLTNQGHSALRRVAAEARRRRIAILCAERDPSRCHRSLIVQALLQMDPGLSVSAIV